MSSSEEKPVVDADTQHTSAREGEKEVAAEGEPAAQTDTHTHTPGAGEEEEEEEGESGEDDHQEKLSLRDCRLYLNVELINRTHNERLAELLVCVCVCVCVFVCAYM
jgi:hypothetical protein